MRLKTYLCSLVVPVAVLLAGPARASPADPAGVAKVAAYAAYVEKARVDWAVPGLAVAVVYNGRVAMLQGFGVRTLGRTEPVDGDTLFSIASLSKGFTAAAIGTLVGEGKLSWDDRVVELLPGFGLSDPWVTGTVTLRDLLAHRVGWQAEVDYLPELGYDLDATLARLRSASLPDGFRTAFTYTNVAYFVAGAAAARRAATQWPKLLRERVLARLGLRRTFPTWAEAQGQPNLASAHTDLGGTMHLIPTPNLDAAPPAAGMQSSAADMAKWAIALLGNQASDGTKLLDAAVLGELLAPQNNYPDDKALAALFPDTHFESYALGWVVKDYHGRKVVWNTGGMRGGSCSIALVPEEKLGVVVLTNGPRTSFPEALVWRAVDRWLGQADKDWSQLRLDRSRAGRVRAERAQKAQEATRESGAALAVARELYASSYTMPLLGDFVVTEEKGRLRARLGKLAGWLEPWRRDVFRLVWDDPTEGTAMCVFQMNAKGRPARVELEDIGAFVRH